MQVDQEVERVPNVQTLSNTLGILTLVLEIFCVKKSNLVLKMGTAFIFHVKLVALDQVLIESLPLSHDQLILLIFCFLIYE